MDASRPDPPNVYRRTRGPGLTLATFVGVATILGSSGGVAGQVTEDSSAVGALIDAYRTTWNGHNASDLAEFFTEDADLIMGTDPIAAGREAVEAWWQGYFARQEPERHVAIEVQAVRLIAPDVAVVNVATTTQGQSAQGEELRSREARGTWVVVRKGASWRISAMRGMPTEQDQIIRASSGEGK
jgi:uncharacterized protein (TIGR02246 family)